MKKVAYHPSGLQIAFDETMHRYRVPSTGQTFISATTFIDRFFPKFDADKMALRCAGKKKYVGMTADEVKTSWADKGRTARDEGTNVHLYAEKLAEEIVAFGFDRKFLDERVNIKVEALSTRCALLFQQVWSAYDLLYNQNFQIIGVEKIIFSPELGIAGTIDLLMCDTNNNDVVVLDWKQNESISKANPWDNCRRPLCHLEATDYTKYSLQLNLYRYLLKREGYFPDAPNFRMALIHLTTEKAIPIKVFPMESEIEMMLEEKTKQKG